MCTKVLVESSFLLTYRLETAVANPCVSDGDRGGICSVITDPCAVYWRSLLDSYGLLYRCTGVIATIRRSRRN